MKTSCLEDRKLAFRLSQLRREITEYNSSEGLEPGEANSWYLELKKKRLELLKMAYEFNFGPNVLPFFSEHASVDHASS